jgi:hypothetical protein
MGHFLYLLAAIVVALLILPFVVDALVTVIGLARAIGIGIAVSAWWWLVSLVWPGAAVMDAVWSVTLLGIVAAWVWFLWLSLRAVWLLLTAAAAAAIWPVRRMIRAHRADARLALPN